MSGSGQDVSVYNLPAGHDFMPALVKGLKRRFGPDLQKALILLPTRRAVRALGDALVSDSLEDGALKGKGGGADILPRLRTLADIDPEEPPFEPGELGLLVKPAISATQRRFELAKLVARFHHRTSDLPLEIDGALSLVDPLLKILDDADMEEVSADKISGLQEISEFAAKHFQNAAVFYDILQKYWPKRLGELGMMSPMARRVAILNALTDLWTESPPNHPVIIAGSTGTLGATARLMKCVSGLKDGLIILPGLDINLRQTAWDQIEPDHPQGALKNLLDVLDLSHREIPNWLVSDSAKARARRRLLSESLVPVGETQDWPSRIANLLSEGTQASPQGDETETHASSPIDTFGLGLSGLSLIEAETAKSEAQTIALIFREVLETPDKRAALITPDPGLARRVRAALRRWNVEVDYSQGEPLEETPLGRFLSRILDCAGAVIQSLDDQADQDRNRAPDIVTSHALSFAALCKHPLFAYREKPGHFRQIWEQAEHTAFRARREKEKRAELEKQAGFLKHLMAGLDDFIPKELGGDKKLSLKEWARALAGTAEILAGTDETQGALRLWQGDAGEQAAKLIEDLIAYGDILEPVSIEIFARIITKMMRGKAVRPRFGTHPRLQILGPLEARMLSADLIILGGLNEGVWPARPSQAPFLSRKMRRELGLSLPERRYGLAAHDFAGLAAHPHVILTRAQRSEEGPMVASRWIWRLQTLVRGALGEHHTALETEKPYLQWAENLDHIAPSEVKAAPEPKPRPPIAARWPEGRKLSITQIKKWVRDPYSIYARYVLGLSPLADIEQTLSVREFGSALHKGLERFMTAHKTRLPEKADKYLIESFQTALSEAGFPDYEIAKESSRLVTIAKDVTDWARERRAQGWQVGGIEAYGSYKIEEVNFTISGIADFIEKSAQGYAVIDYKTGAPSNVAVVKAGFDPQLPLTAYLLLKGGFKGLKSGPTQDLHYLRISGTAQQKSIVHSLTPMPGVRSKSAPLPAPEYVEAALDDLKKLIAEFDDPETIYYSQPRIQYTHDYGDYDDLARRGEWMRIVGGDAGGTQARGGG